MILFLSFYHLWITVLRYVADLAKPIWHHHRLLSIGVILSTNVYYRFNQYVFIFLFNFIVYPKMTDLPYPLLLHFNLHIFITNFDLILMFQVIYHQNVYQFNLHDSICTFFLSLRFQVIYHFNNYTKPKFSKFHCNWIWTLNYRVLFICSSMFVKMWLQEICYLNLKFCTVSIHYFKRNIFLC